MKLFEHKTKRGVLVDETGREVTLEEIHSCRESLPQPLADLNSTLTESDTIGRRPKSAESFEAIGLCPAAARIAACSSRSLRTAQRRPGVLGCVSVGEGNL